MKELTSIQLKHLITKTEDILDRMQSLYNEVDEYTADYSMLDTVTYMPDGDVDIYTVDYHEDYLPVTYIPTSSLYGYSGGKSVQSILQDISIDPYDSGVEDALMLLKHLGEYTGDRALN